MNTSASPFTVTDTAPELARRFALILAGLGALVARRFLRMPHLMRFTMLLWSRLNRAVRRFERALTRKPAKVRASVVGADRARRADPSDRPRPIALPRGQGWLVRELGWEAAAFMAQLEALLAEVEMRAAVTASPAVGRIIRPICRMLGVSAEVAPAVMHVPKVPAAVVERRLEPGGAVGHVGDIDVFVTSG